MRVIKAKQDKIVKGIRSILDVYNGSGNDDDRMNRIMGILREKEVEEAFEDFIKSGVPLHSTELKFFKTEIMSASTTTESKMELLKLLSSN